MLDEKLSSAIEKNLLGTTLADGNLLNVESTNVSSAVVDLINSFVNVYMDPSKMVDGVYPASVSKQIMMGWTDAWFIFAGFSLVVAVLFAFMFKYKHTPQN